MKFNMAARVNAVGKLILKSPPETDFAEAILEVYTATLILRASGDEKHLEMRCVISTASSTSSQKEFLCDSIKIY
jgi:hypothetical protein